MFISLRRYRLLLLPLLIGIFALPLFVRKRQTHPIQPYLPAARDLQPIYARTADLFRMIAPMRDIDWMTADRISGYAQGNRPEQQWSVVCLDRNGDAILSANWDARTGELCAVVYDAREYEVKSDTLPAASQNTLAYRILSRVRAEQAARRWLIRLGIFGEGSHAHLTCLPELSRYGRIRYAWRSEQRQGIIGIDARSGNLRIVRSHRLE